MPYAPDGLAADVRQPDSRFHSLISADMSAGPQPRGHHSSGGPLVALVPARPRLTYLYGRPSDDLVVRADADVVRDDPHVVLPRTQPRRDRVVVASRVGADGCDLVAVDEYMDADRVARPVRIVGPPDHAQRAGVLREPREAVRVPRRRVDQWRALVAADPVSRASADGRVLRGGRRRRRRGSRDVAVRRGRAGQGGYCPGCGD